MKTIKIITLLIVTVLFINSVNAQKEQKKYHDNGNLKVEGQYDDNGKGTGQWKFHFEDGTLEKVGSYVDGGRNGDWEFYYETGELHELIKYVDNNRQGKKKAYYRNGKLKHYGTFVDNKANGLWVFYNIKGFVKEYYYYENGEEQKDPPSGCIYGNCEDSYGIKYVGAWKKSFYEGNFINGKLNGKGTELNNAYSIVRHYVGNFVNEKKDGLGIETSDGNKKYDGHWKDDEKNGEGTERLYNELLGGVLMEKYVGNWKDGEKSGQATIIEYGLHGKVEKRKLVGDWTWGDNDEPSGIGKEYKNGELVYEGAFENGKPFKTEGCLAGDCENGQGVFVFPDKTKYIGQFKNGKKNGLGFELDAKKGLYTLTTWKDNEVADGLLRIFNTDNEIVLVLEMKDGKPVAGLSDNGVEIGCVKGDCENGFGHYVWEGGAKYIGEFKDGLFSGYAVVTDVNGKYVGKYKDGKRSGYGRALNTNNVVIKQGIWNADLYYENLSIEKKYSKDQKCTLGNCIDGFGIYIETFEPGWSDAYREYVNTYEIKYEGFWKDGKFHGLGFTDDRMAKTFVGLFEKGEPVE